jgi:hypothetical protein
MGYTILGMHAGHQGMDKMIRAMLIPLCLIVKLSRDRRLLVGSQGIC